MNRTIQTLLRNGIHYQTTEREYGRSKLEYLMELYRVRLSYNFIQQNFVHGSRGSE